ncbi:MAG: N-acetyltransferase, partial [Prolixibacteraceae bacterium]|nr:N-acetyltransferase [Prolixibacteraceae bacterium]
MELQIRKINRNEFFQTENITREAFWNLYKPGCDEHLVLHQLRKSRSYLEELDIVAVLGEEITGHILSTKAKVTDENNMEHEVLCIGPVSVLPSFQNKRIGSKLLEHSISEAKKLGFKGMILFGNPDYYHRFGFRNSQEYGITTKEG